ncbi:hypothetical protein J3E68DRAFT_408665 [Trichoderma sp. SZMC 28012]
MINLLANLSYSQPTTCTFLGISRYISSSTMSCYYYSFPGASPSVLVILPAKYMAFTTSGHLLHRLLLNGGITAVLSCAMFHFSSLLHLQSATR